MSERSCTRIALIRQIVRIVDYRLYPRDLLNPRDPRTKRLSGRIQQPQIHILQRVPQLADELLTLIPTGKIGYKEVNEDPRDYRVNADKIRTRLGFEITKTVPQSMREIARALNAGVIPNPDDPKYSNV